MTIIIRWFLAVTAAVIVLASPNDARAANYTMCANLDTTLENVDLGEDYLLDPDGPYIARYLRATVSISGHLIVGPVYANSAGCVSFTHGSLGPFKLKLWSEMKVPRTDNAALTNTVKVTDDTSLQASWEFNHTFISGGLTSKTFTVPANWANNLLVVTRQSLERFSNGISSQTYLVRHEDSDDCPGNSCNGTYSPPTDTATVYVTPDHNGRKFAIAHELGHALVGHWFDLNPLPDEGIALMYAYNAGGTSCEWSAPGAHDHAMHSMEYAAAGLIEGFAQFYATYAFNNHAQTDAFFYYFKDGTGVTDVNMDVGPTGGLTAFMNNTCSGPKTGKGNELDWARTFWNYRTNSGTKPSNNAILDHIYTGFDNPNIWHTGVDEPAGGDYDNTVNLLLSAIDSYDAANGTAFESRWQGEASINGIDHPDP